ncbi:MAG: Hsp33 family molecular chaperone HslO, partial [Lachnospiraceae bacterium]
KEEVISQLEENLKNITSVTALLDRGDTPELLLKELLGNMGLEITETMPTQFYCNCTKERVTKALISIGKEDIQEMIEDGKEIAVNCHFCNTDYTFTIEELKDISQKSRA